MKINTVFSATDRTGAFAVDEGPLLDARPDPLISAIFFNTRPLL
jgi:hypothetical protein